MKTRQRVTGIGGIFFKTKNPAKLCGWYRKHLGLPIDEQWCGWSFEWRDAKTPSVKGATVWSAFAADAKYFGRRAQEHMINYRVANLRRVLGALRKEGVWIDPRTEESEYGKFAWIKDGEGNRIELWEPPKPRRKVRRG